MDEQSLFLGILIGLFLYFLYTKFSRSSFSPSPSDDSSMYGPFQGMTDPNAVQQLYTAQIQTMTAQMSADLASAKAQGQAGTQLFPISDSWHDKICMLMKQFARWNLANTKAASPAPST